ncbi:MAG TPA: hypothetical protein PKA64_00510, partial [Myxococcota bacterium]|nr:hypothetical protein [Myxococcota bacterium]
MEAAFDAVGVVAALAVALAVVRGATPVRAAVAAVALAVVVGFTGAVVGTATMLLGIGAALIASARAGGGEPG